MSVRCHKFWLVWSRVFCRGESERTNELGVLGHKMMTIFAVSSGYLSFFWKTTVEITRRLPAPRVAVGDKRSRYLLQR